MLLYHFFGSENIVLQATPATNTIRAFCASLSPYAEQKWGLILRTPDNMIVLRFFDSALGCFVVLPWLIANGQWQWNTQSQKILVQPPRGGHRAIQQREHSYCLTDNPTLLRPSQRTSFWLQWFAKTQHRMKKKTTVQGELKLAVVVVVQFASEISQVKSSIPATANLFLRTCCLKNIRRQRTWQKTSTALVVLPEEVWGTKTNRHFKFEKRRR